MYEKIDLAAVMHLEKILLDIICNVGFLQLFFGARKICFGNAAIVGIYFRKNNYFKKYLHNGNTPNDF